MKFTIGWLEEHLETTAGLDEIVERLTMLGLEVEGVVERSRGLEDFVVARVLEAKPHPHADRLKVCTVDTGSGTVEVVCGAANARQGLIGVFAAEGMVIPGSGITLKKTDIRGVSSNGMLLSEREMGLSDEHEGIVELTTEAALGTPAVTAMGLDDPVIDIAITPNRPDCLGVRGIARDLAAAALGTLKPIAAEKVPGTFESPLKVRLDFEAECADACPYFVGRAVRGVRNGESPGWLKERLLSVGLRPISALVDITNLMTIGFNRPLHVFDMDKLAGDLVVRLAKPGERFMGLNDTEIECDATMTVIADDQGADALGGVIGGARTGVTGETVSVFIESAYFDPLRTAATGRKLNLMSEARYRFERGIDPTFLMDGMEMATRLVLDLCGGEASEPVVAGSEPDWRRSIELRFDRIKTLGGLDVDPEKGRHILETLGFTVDTGTDRMTAQVPPWRPDVVGEADLVEEALRVIGYDRIPAVLLEPPTALPQPAETPGRRRLGVARRTLAERGLVEAVTLSFLASATADLFGGVDDSVRLVNPISSDLDVMRPSLLPNLVAAAGRNADRGTADGALFEVGPQYAGAAPGDQETVAAGLRAGSRRPRSWQAPVRPVDLFDAKADALGALAAVGAPVDKLQVTADAPAWYHPGRSGALTLGPKTVLARFGEIHPGVLNKMGVKGPVAAFEVFLDRLPAPKRRKSAARPHLELPALQPVGRDFAFVVDDGVPVAAVLAAARGADKKLIAEVRLFDAFTGGGLGEGEKSLAVNVTLQPTEKTLTDAEIEAVASRVVAAVEKATGGVLRT